MMGSPRLRSRVWLTAVLIIGLVTTAHGSWATDGYEVGSFYLDPHATDKLLLVRGHKLTGKIVFQTRGSRILINGIEWLDLAPPRPAERTVPTRFDSTQYLPIPWIRRAMKSGKSLMAAEKEYNERRYGLMRDMVEEYRRWSHRGPIEARARALALIDTSIASLHADREAEVSENGATLYFPGYGWEGLDMPNLPPRTEPPPTVAERGRGEARLVERNFDGPGPTVVLLSDLTMTMHGGQRAIDTMAQLNALVSSKGRPLDPKLRSLKGGLPPDMLERVRLEIARANEKR